MTINLLLIALFVFSMLIMSLNLAKKRKKIIFFGDTINDLDTRPGGYLAWFDDNMKEIGVEDDYLVIQSIKNGDKITDLATRLQTHVLIKDANIVVIYVGVQDVWDHYNDNSGTDLDTFIDTYHTILEKLYLTNTRAILCTPSALLKPGFSAEMQAELASYAAAVREIAKHHDALVIDIEKLAHAFLGENASISIPQVNINRIIANEIWRVIKDMK